MPRMWADGRVTIPKRIRDKLGLTPGTEVEFVPQPDGWIRIVKVGHQGQGERGGCAIRPRPQGA